jgi:hypothetical protein
MSQHRIVVLQEDQGERYLPIWIGPFEADAITIQLQDVEVARPLTHDLLKNVIDVLGGEVIRVVINDLQNDTFYAQIILQTETGDTIEVDSRPSDAIALAVRVDAPIYVEDDVMDRAGMEPEEELAVAKDEETTGSDSVFDEGDEDLDVFRDFIEGLDIDT